MDIPSSFTGGEEVCVWKNGDIRCVRRCIARQKFYAVLQKTSSGRAKVKIKSEITPPLTAFLSLRSTLWQNYSEDSPKSLQARKAHYHALDTKPTEARKPFLPDLPSKIRGISLENATHGGQYTEISPLPPVASPILTSKSPFSPYFPSFPTAFSFISDGIFCLQVTIYWGQSKHLLGSKWTLFGVKTITSEQESQQNSRETQYFHPKGTVSPVPKQGIIGAADSKTRGKAGFFRFR